MITDRFKTIMSQFLSLLIGIKIRNSTILLAMGAWSRINWKSPVPTHDPEAVAKSRPTKRIHTEPNFK